MKMGEFLEELAWLVAEEDKLLDELETVRIALDDLWRSATNYDKREVVRCLRFLHHRKEDDFDRPSSNTSFPPSLDVRLTEDGSIGSIGFSGSGSDFYNLIKDSL